MTLPSSSSASPTGSPLRNERLGQIAAGTRRGAEIPSSLTTTLQALGLDGEGDSAIEQQQGPTSVADNTTF